MAYCEPFNHKYWPDNLLVENESALRAVKVGICSQFSPFKKQKNNSKVKD